MITVHKYPFQIDDSFQLRLPAGAQLLTIQVQGATPCMWFKVDTEQPKYTKTFYVRGTGHDCSDVGEYLGTFQLHSGQLVFHVFGE